MQWTSMKAQWLAATLGVALAPQAAGAANLDTYSVTVNLKDLDLASWNGQRVAQKRVASAAKEVCREADLSADDSCREAALRDAIVQVHQLVAQAEVRSNFAAR
jgi:UrcA family protein